MEYVKAFLIGGILCVLVQLLLDHTKLLPGRVMVLLVVSGVLLGSVGVYEPFSRWAGCGATVPLCGFGYRLWDGVKTAVDENGFLGLFTGGLTNAATGISGTLLFGYFAAVFFKPNMKK